MVTELPTFGSCVIVSVLLGVWMDVASGMPSIQLIPPYPVIQGSVTMTVTGITGRIQDINWFKEPRTNTGNQILTYFPGDLNPLTPGPLYNTSFLNRVAPFPDGSLLISNLKITDEGYYIVKIQQTETASDASVYLKLYEMVDKPNITTSTSLPKENDGVTLTCNTSTNTERIVWSRVPPGATLSSDNRTVSISKINRSDSGEYSCEASNPVSKKSSDPITITVAYGPENVKVKVGLLPNDFISLECSADSVPPATYIWKLNGTVLNTQQNPLQVDPKKAENEGNYTCVANNSVIQRIATDSVYVNATIAPTPYQTMCPSGCGLGGGEIAAIVIGPVFGIFVIEVIVYFVLKAKRKTPSSVYENTHVSEKHNYEMTLAGTQAKTSEESNYEELTHKDKSIYSTMESRKY